MNTESRSGLSASHKITLLMLGVIILVTIFFLPQFVSDPWVDDGAEDAAVVQQPSTTDVAPSTAAELTRYRQESQTVLAEVMTLRDRLTERSVEQWGQVEFQQAQDAVTEGDELYSYGDYEDSLQRYQQARDQLAGLQQQGDEILAKARADAEQAVADLNTPMARSSLEMALSIAPDDPDLLALSARADNLDQVRSHLEAGDQALASDRYREAQQEYQQAVNLDGQNQRARESLSRSKREVTASVFRGHMSRGFAALERNDFDGARSAFNEAGKVSPSDPSVQRALEQVENLQSGQVVNAELQRAAQLESREEWREALNIYEAMLKEDPSLTDARVRLIPARVRADLDDQMVAYIDDPLRLSSQAEYQSAQRLLNDARGIPDPGPRLNGQIEQLASIIEKANSPVDVVFRSDNLTHVVLYRVADLGQFEQVSLKLRPGRYVAAGSRGGFRDVRVEFTITGESTQETVVVQCEEPIG